MWTFRQDIGRKFKKVKSTSRDDLIVLAISKLCDYIVETPFH